ncbi:hypothetical protein CANCADRAFT_59037 [Tortispora caseinolytica NRRL Y-17796]|uniref:3',5'-cyclic-nucleotide phosphodiesterase n=1 Tax=Tortispora caseinolytica NRRL Y-17796 TaxID=767744 RepID=A0A1E4TIX1_9ASCO|nr:hypothetical protein CANCADRAFT_59037 [Tortispora caseinolytica NRRL Y-17796]
MEPQFLVSALGPRGGPFEDSCTCFLIKAYSEAWDDGCLAALDAGSLLSGLRNGLLLQLLPNDPLAQLLKRGMSKASPIRIDENMIADSALPFKMDSSPTRALYDNCIHIVRHLIKSFCITHAHLDHISALALCSPIFIPHSPKRVYSSQHSIDLLQKHIFNDSIWPDLTTSGTGLISLHEIDSTSYIPIANGLEAIAFPLSHGNVLSLGFLVRNSSSDTYALFLGDMEADSISKKDYNSSLWKHVSPLIHANKLRALFMECSYPDERPSDCLFGHLTPTYAIQELLSLRPFGVFHAREDGREWRNYTRGPH